MSEHPWWTEIAKTAAEEAREFGGETAAKAVFHAVKSVCARWPGAAATVKNQRDDLLAALERMAEVVDTARPYLNSKVGLVIDNLNDAERMARAAIAKAKKD